ncbi:uncharacterized protein LOC126265585 [Aethina tumida]|uniref:uncharacterized protein LOC126265585 n=1 Tax=Aethina tumida TaxID=116153 RepID=UPI0021497105|nr:uncharacterized protein LOC126265585 [Aethina tumida]
MCKLPTFWRTNPDLWFIQAEIQFQVHRVTSDNSGYNAVVIALDIESIQEVSDLIRAPPESGKYETLKQAVLARFLDSPDAQLHELITSIELGDKKPSQLLREMRSLAGDCVGDQVLRVRWQNLLPAQTRRMLLLFKKKSLDELAELADDLHTIGPSCFNQVQHGKYLLKTQNRYDSLKAGLIEVDTVSESISNDNDNNRAMTKLGELAQQRKPREFLPSFSRESDKAFQTYTTPSNKTHAFLMRRFDDELEPREMGEGLAEEHSIKIHNIYKMKTQFRPRDHTKMDEPKR